jgi:hypothetical protein
VEDSWWREVTLLYVAHADAGPIVEACLARETIRALTLAFECTDQAIELAPQLRQQLDNLVADGSNASSDPALLRLTAGITVTRHLRDRVGVAPDAYICIRPITERIYRIFLEHTKASRKDRVPDWPELDDSIVDNEIALGMRGLDALAFIAWVNDLTDAEPMYRLPTRLEVDDFATRRLTDAARYGIWVTAGTDRAIPELWMQSGIDHPHAIREEMLQGYLSMDIHVSSLPLFLLQIRARAFVSALIRICDRTRDLGRDLARDFTRARDAAYARVGNLDPALDSVFDRALRRAHDLDLALGRALDPLPDRILVSALAGKLDYAFDSLPNEELERTVPGNVIGIYYRRIRDLTHAVADVRVLAEDLVTIQNHARTIHYDLNRILNVDLVRAAARIRDLDHHIDLVRTIARELDHDLSLARYPEAVIRDNASNADLVRILDQNLAVARSSHLVRALALDLEVKLDVDLDINLGVDLDTAADRALVSIAGDALSRSLSAAISTDSGFRSDPSAALLERFSSHLIEMSGIATDAQPVSLDSLGDKVKMVLEAIGNLHGALSNRSKTAWLLEVARRLEASALPIFDRRKRLSPDDATAIRLAALCIAAEIPEQDKFHDEVDLQGLLREIAIGVTLLQRRQSGQVRPVEAILVSLV